MTQTVRLVGPSQRQLAHQLIDKAGDGYVVQISEPKRTDDQNAKMWAMLSDISRQKPLGRRCTPEQWKALAMHACGWAVQFENGLDGQPFPVGFRSSRMTKKEMATLIEWLMWFGAENNIVWSEAYPGV